MATALAVSMEEPPPKPTITSGDAPLPAAAWRHAVSPSAMEAVVGSGTLPEKTVKAKPWAARAAQMGASIPD
jgi:hypothetical protein